MRHLIVRRALTVVPLFALTMVGHAQEVWLERAYFPTETVRFVPTSAVYATSFSSPVLSTSYAAPIYTTSYSAPLTTSYELTQSAYVVPNTIMVRPYRRFFGRRPIYSETRYVDSGLIPTAYFPTTFVPTSVRMPIVTTSMAMGMCCETAAPMTTSAPMAVPQQAPVAERTPNRVIESGPSTGGEPPLSETQVKARESGKSPLKSQPTGGYSTQQPLPRANSTALPAEADAASPPAPSGAGAGSTVRDPEKEAVPPAIPSAVSPKQDELAPLPNVELPPIPGSQGTNPGTDAGYTRRDSRKPLTSVSIPGRPVSGRTLLEGKVVSDATGAPLEGVAVILTDRLGRFEKTATSDMQGRYRVSLPDGDWKVQVTSNSGRLYEISQLTVAGGQISDSDDRPVGSLLISR